MNLHGSESQGFRDIRRAVSRYRGSAAIVFSCVLVLAIVIVLFYPRHYKSEAKVFVRKGRETVSLDPTATTGQVTTLVDSRESEINSVVAMLNSRGLFECVVAALGPEQVLRPEVVADAAPDSEEPFVPSWLDVTRLVPEIDPVSTNDRAIRRIEKGLTVAAERGSNVITLKYVDRSPYKAQLIVAALLDAYEEEHLRVNRTRGSREFFDQQVRLKHAEWQTAAAALQALKNEIGFASIDQHRQLLESRMNRVRDQLSDAETQLATVNAKTLSLDELVQSLPENKVSEKEAGHANIALDGMRQQLYNLEVEERESTARLTENHPKLTALRKQLNDARQILTTLESRRVLTKTGINTERETLHLALLQSQAEAKSLAAKADSLRTEHARVSNELRSLNGRETEVAQLQQQVDLAAANYRSYAENLEYSRIDEALELDRISNVNIYQPASLDTRPVSPRKGIVSALGLLLAVAGGVLVAVVRDRMDTTMPNRDGAKGELDLSMLASLLKSNGETSRLVKE